MARRIRSTLETRTQRLRLAVRRKSYHAAALGRGTGLLYRRNQGNGTWSLRGSDGDGKIWINSIGLADDHDEADGRTILNYWQASDPARKLARAEDDDVVTDSTRPATVDEALNAYERDLEARGANRYNARMPRVHLTPLLLGKPVQLLGSKELEIWRNSLLASLKTGERGQGLQGLASGAELGRITRQAHQECLPMGNRVGVPAGCGGPQQRGVARRGDLAVRERLLCP
jgi:hypothetical protein